MHFLIHVEDKDLSTCITDQYYPIIFQLPSCKHYFPNWFSKLVPEYHCLSGKLWYLQHNCFIILHMPLQLFWLGQTCAYEQSVLSNWIIKSEQLKYVMKVYLLYHKSLVKWIPDLTYFMGLDLVCKPITPFVAPHNAICCTICKSISQPMQHFWPLMAPVECRSPVCIQANIFKIMGAFQKQSWALKSQSS